MKDLVRIATRKSPLALWQAEYVKQQLLDLHPGIEVELVPMTTRGDQILDRSLSKVGGKGLFIKELEQALLDKVADIAVHSMKDVPMEFPDGLALAAICTREDPFDAFVSNQYGCVEELPEGARLGTSSLRRSSQLQHCRKDLTILDCRGNVNTRLAKLDAGEYDAIILAVAGLKRLQMPARIRTVLDTQLCLPAPGQGAVGIELRADDGNMQALVEGLNDQHTELTVTAERAMNRALQGGCQVPIAAFAELHVGRIMLRGRVASVNGETLLEVSGNTMATLAGADTLGRELAQELLQQGADKILAAVYA